jgi:hypothetical protein
LNHEFLVSKQQGNFTMQDQYIHDAIYAMAVSRLEMIVRSFDAAAPDDLRTRIVEVLGDLGLWPDACLADRDEVLARLVA